MNYKTFFITGMVTLMLVLTSCHKELFIECESFAYPGGWVVDPQFVEQMGSPYLMAHGMGEPVENAFTTIQIPSPGSYHVWARTTDWAPGNWSPPGQFSILMDGKNFQRPWGIIKDGVGTMPVR